MPGIPAKKEIGIDPKVKYDKAHKETEGKNREGIKGQT
jgi:hypothetical protein